MEQQTTLLESEFMQTEVSVNVTDVTLPETTEGAWEACIDNVLAFCDGVQHCLNCADEIPFVCEEINCTGGRSNYTIFQC